MTSDSTPQAAAKRTLEETREALQRFAPGVDMDALIIESRRRFPYQPYHAMPALKQAIVGIREQFGQYPQSLVLRSLLARLVVDFREEQLDFKVTEGVRILYRASLHRVIAQPAEQRQLDDAFLKDLALACGHLFPAGERVVEPCSVLQRSLLYQSGLWQAFRLSRACLRSGGTRPVFRLHVHLSEAPRLSIDTWRQTCMHLAQMLRLNPRVKGVVGASWFYDPTLPSISPHLSFINNVVRLGGARWFFSHVEGSESGAFVSSARRRVAFESGEYTPQCYVMFWPRRDALAWLDREEKVA